MCSSVCELVQHVELAVWELHSSQEMVTGGKGIATLLALRTYALLWSFSHGSHRSWSRSLIHRRPLHQFVQKEGCVKLNTQWSSYKLTFKTREHLSWANNTFRNFYSIPCFSSLALTQRLKELYWSTFWGETTAKVTLPTPWMSPWTWSWVMYIAASRPKPSQPLPSL